MSVAVSSPSSIRRKAALGLTVATMLALSGGAAAAAETGDAWSAALPDAQVEETLFPLGKPPALIEASGGIAEAPALWLDDATLAETDHITTGAILSVRQLAGMSAFSFPGRIMPAERHIAIGLMLLAAAGMAAVSFGLWRWQVRGLALEA